MTPGFTIISDFEGLQRLQPEWDDILRADRGATPFLSFAWTYAWLRSFSRSYERFVVLHLHQAGKFRGIIPFVQRRTWRNGLPVRTLELAGGDDAVFKGPIGEGDVTGLIDCALRGLSELPSWDTIELDGLADDRPWYSAFARALEQRVLRYHRHPSHAAPFLTLLDDYEAQRKNLKKSLRQNLSRKLNMAEREGVVFERVTGSAVRPDHVRAAQDVERRSWKGQRGVGIFIDEAHMALHLGLLERAASYEVDFLFLKIADRPIAFQYGFLQGNRYYAYNTSYDEAYQRISPGMLAINALLQQLIPRGVQVFDFLIGDDSYKRDWTSEARSLEGFTIYRSSPTGRLAFELERLRPPVRQMRNAIRGLLQTKA